MATALALRTALRKRTASAIWGAFYEAYNKAYAFYDNDKPEECLQKCRAILGQHSELPRYVSICTLILVCLVVEDRAIFYAARSEAGMCSSHLIVFC